jgi:hypothetical protein
MALTASGQLSLGDIATEMGVELSNVSLTTQSTTGINTNSESKPDGSTPHAISEFYSYDHSASPPLTAFSVDANPYEDGEGACAEGSETATWYHAGGGTYPTTWRYSIYRFGRNYQPRQMDFIGWMNRHHFLWK